MSWAAHDFETHVIQCHFGMRVSFLPILVVTADSRVWAKIGTVLPARAMLTLYRAGMFYGVTRLLFWTAWAHIANSFVWDLSWGGPDWIIPVHL